MNVTVIGVAGGTGSGKSTLVKRLQEAFKEEEVVTLCHDYYYKAHPELTYEERTKLNYDHPQSFDTDMLVEHIRTLKNNVPIEHPVYSFVDHNRTAETVLVKPSKVIIVDGILIFENKELRDLMDIKVYVDTDADIRLARRILRDVCERGRTMQSVISQYTTLVKRLQEAFKEEEVVTLCHDYYYKAHPELTYEERTKLNYDHPQSFDTDMLVEHIRTLKNNVPIEHPVYSFVDHNRTAETVLVKPSKVIIVDGILIFENKELRDLMDIKVYVDTDADIRLARRILRDVCERGRTMQSVISQYTTTVKPMHEEFVEPSKKYADVIIPEGGFNSVAVSMLIRSIQSQINAK